MGAPGRAEPAGPRRWSRSGSSGLRSGDERGERGYLAGESPLLSPELRGEIPPGSACPPRPFPVSPALAMADGCGTGKEPPYPGAAAALRRWEQLRRRAAAPWARGLLAVAAGLGLFYAALRVPLRLRDGLAAGEAGGERGGVTLGPPGRVLCSPNGALSSPRRCAVPGLWSTLGQRRGREPRFLSCAVKALREIRAAPCTTRHVSGLG